jgi:hypothetical protein
VAVVNAAPMPMNAVRISLVTVAGRHIGDRIEDYRANARTADRPAQTAAGPSLRDQVAARAEQARQDTAARRARAERDLAAQRAQQRRAQDPRQGGGRGPRR